jgi:hypothetical protein
MGGNSDDICGSELCGCYSCYAIFPPTAIVHWMGEDDTLRTGEVTAICPHCGVDTVIGDHEGYVITKCLLKRMKRHGRL